MSRRQQHRILPPAFNAQVPPSSGTLIGFIDPSYAASVTKDGSNNVDSIACRVSGDVFANTLTARPLWVASGLGGVPVLRFAAASAQCLIDTSSSLAAALDAAAPFTAIHVGKRTTYGTVPARATTWAIGDGSTAWVGHRWGSTGNDDFDTFLYGTFVGDQASTIAVATDPHVVTIWNDGVNQRSWVNGMAGVVAAHVASAAATRMLLGGMSNGGGPILTLNGDLGLLLVYSTALSTADRLRAESWARIKCGLAA